MSERAYALKESVKDFNGSHLILPPDGRTLDVKARLGENGVIVTSDEVEQAAFDALPALKQVPVPDKSAHKSTSTVKGGER